MRIRRSVAAALTAIGLTITAALAVATPAQAAYGCSGTLLEPAKAITSSSGTKIGELRLYWDASLGTNCAATVHVGPTYGVALPTSVYLFVCDGNTPSYCETSRYRPALTSWSGTVSYYAWQTSVPSAGRCVKSSGTITYQGTSRGTETAWGHCS